MIEQIELYYFYWHLKTEIEHLNMQSWNDHNCISKIVMTFKHCYNRFGKETSFMLMFPRSDGYLVELKMNHATYLSV